MSRAYFFQRLALRLIRPTLHAESLSVNAVPETAGEVRGDCFAGTHLCKPWHCVFPCSIALGLTWIVIVWQIMSKQFSERRYEIKTLILLKIPRESTNRAKEGFVGHQRGLWGFHWPLRGFALAPAALLPHEAIKSRHWSNSNNSVFQPELRYERILRVLKQLVIFHNHYSSFSNVFWTKSISDEKTYRARSPISHTLFAENSTKWEPFTGFLFRPYLRRYSLFFRSEKCFWKLSTSTLRFWWWNLTCYN